LGKTSDPEEPDREAAGEGREAQAKRNDDEWREQKQQVDQGQ
jgi:hypothetical protein